MTIPPLHIVPDSPAPEPARSWSGGIQLKRRAIIAVYEDGEIVDDGSMLVFNIDGTLHRQMRVNPSLGFQLDAEGRIMLSASDPLMQPRAATTRQVFEKRRVLHGEQYWNGRDWVVWDCGPSTSGEYIVAVGATEAPRYPLGGEPIEPSAPAATVDGMTLEQLDEVLARAHWEFNSTMGGNDPRPPKTQETIAAITAPAYSRWLERTKGGAK